MSEIFPQRILSRVVDAQAAGEDPRQTGPFHLDVVGPATSCSYLQDVQVNYEMAGVAYTDLLPVAPVYVWQWSTDPGVTDVQATRGAARLTFDTKTKRWKVFSLAALQPGPAVGAGTPYVIEERWWERLTGAYDVLALEFAGSPGTVRVPVGGCSACGPGIKTRQLTLVAGTPVIASPDPTALHPPPPVPRPGYDDAGGDPKLAKLAAPTALFKAPDNTLYIGCEPYTSVNGKPASGTLRRIQGGVIDTVAGVGDFGLTFTIGDPVPGVGPADSVVLGAVTGITQDPVTQALTFMGLLTDIGTLEVTDDFADNACDIRIAFAVPYEGTPDRLGLLNGLGGPGPGVVGELTRNWSFALWHLAAGGVAPFTYAMGFDLARASDGRLFADSGDRFSFSCFTGDGIPVFGQGPLNRLDDISNTTVGDLVWYWTVDNQAAGSSTGGGHCEGTFRYPLKDPRQLWLDQDRYLYIAAAGNNQILMYDLQDNTMTLVFGHADGTPGFAPEGFTMQDVNNHGFCALNGPEGICMDSAGNLVVADTGNAVIRRIAKGSGAITTIAGIPHQPGWSLWDATTSAVVPDSALKLGPATSTQLNAPARVWPGANCSLYIADRFNHRVLFLGCPGNR